MIRKEELFDRGLLLITRWCELNGFFVPRVVTNTGKPTFGVCAYYRDDQVDIWVRSCSAVGLAGRQWSYPGYCVDRTPYGVLAHELGHHVDGAHGPRGGTLSHEWRANYAPLTAYCPNDNEWFAEWFRLFVTNPDLFRCMSPELFGLFSAKWPAQAEIRPWDAVLAGSPRHLAAAQNRISKAAR